MDKKLARILLVGKNEKDFFHLRERLTEQRCQCTFVSSYSEAAQLLHSQRFELVLCGGQPGIRTLLPSVIGSSTSIFCAHAVEDSCLWVPVALNGDECLGAPPLRPGEFSDTLKRIVDAINVSSDSVIAAAS